LPMDLVAPLLAKLNTSADQRSAETLTQSLQPHVPGSAGGTV
jgi:hypothetical protein